MKLIGTLLISAPLWFSYHPDNILQARGVKIPMPSCSCSSGSSGGSYSSGSSRSSYSQGHGAAAGGAAGARSVTDDAADINMAKAANDESDLSVRLQQALSDTGEDVSVKAIDVDSSFIADEWQPVDSPSMIYMMPKTINEYESVYGYDPSYTAIKAMQTADSKVNLSNSIKASYISDLESYIISSNSKPVVIFAHSSQKGNIIHLPDGSTVRAEDIHRFCLENNKNCMILTCHGDDFSIKNRVTADEVIDIWDDMVYASSHSDLTVGNFRSLFVSKRKAKKNKRNIAISLTFSVSGGSYYLILSNEKDDR